MNFVPQFRVAGAATSVPRFCTILQNPTEVQGGSENVLKPLDFGRRVAWFVFQHCSSTEALQNLRAEQRHAVETALWSGLRALEESASLYRRTADRAGNANQEQSRSIYEDRASTAETNSETLRNFLVTLSSPETDELAEGRVTS